MKRCIATLDVGGGSLHPASRESLEAAACRWDADLVIFTEPLARCHIWWQKTFAIDHLLQYDHVLQIDADVLIAEDCPSPFSECNPGRLGVCRDLQHPSQYRLARWLSNQTGGGLLLVPQFTLAADTKKGMRASFTGAASPEIGRTLFEHAASVARARIGERVATGRFGAHMRVSLTNDGPVTFWLEAHRPAAGP